jgi:hypothetical protein
MKVIYEYNISCRTEKSYFKEQYTHVILCCVNMDIYHVLTVLYTWALYMNYIYKVYICIHFLSFIARYNLFPFAGIMAGLSMKEEPN